METTYTEASPPAFPNAYTSMDHCTARSAHSADCRALTACQSQGKSVYVADKNTDTTPRDVMTGYPGFQYHEDCVREPERVFAQYK